jgi:phosphatidyl-myo-inositol alpha-mannosyltransferase
MRIAITSPTNWPHVRRGAERFINELAGYLASRGHSVTIICGKPGKSELVNGNGYTTRYCRRWWHPVFGKLGLLEFHRFFFPCLLHLLWNRYDAVLCLTFMDAFAAGVASRFTKTEYAFVVNGIPPRKQYFRSLSLRGAVFRRAVLSASSVVGISDYVATYLENRWGRRCERLPIPVDKDEFRPRATSKNGRPVILCAAALNDARKGGSLLMDAFNLLKRRRPDAILKLAAPMSAATQEGLSRRVEDAYRADVQFVSAAGDLPALFSAATVSVLPSMWEPYGMVILESMAAGTPVVATRDGALPELITDQYTGRLFDPGEGADVEPTNSQGLAQALEETMDLALDPATAQRCRAHALRYSWDVLGPRYERLLQQVQGARERELEAIER